MCYRTQQHYCQWVLKMFINLGKTSVTRSAAPNFSRCSSFQCFSRMWSVSLISCRGPALHKWHGHCPSPWCICRSDTVFNPPQIPQPGPTRNTQAATSTTPLQLHNFLLYCFLQYIFFVNLCVSINGYKNTQKQTLGAYM